jgi:hypothetical protein
MSSIKDVQERLQKTPFGSKVSLEGKVVLASFFESYANIERQYLPGRTHSVKAEESGPVLEVEGVPFARGEIVQEGDSLSFRIKEFIR